MPRSAFITGITGFAGSHLAELCLAEGLAVGGLSRGGGGANLAAVRERVTVHAADLGDAREIRRILAEEQPDVVFHLAAETAAGTPEGSLFATNVVGTIDLLEAAAALPAPPVVLIASSSAVYGKPADPQRPVDEEAPLNPTSSYGLSKAAQDEVSARLGPLLRLSVVRVRAFNHTGPRERDSFVASSVAHQIAQAEAGLRPPRIAVGRLDTLRDFSDVRDIVRGYFLAAMRGRPGEAYNLAAGRAVAIESLVTKLASLARIEIVISQDEARMRSADVPCQIGGAGKAERELGWTPSISLDKSLADLLDHWRAAIS